jgi:hypothetical protein
MTTFYMTAKFTYPHNKTIQVFSPMGITQIEDV